jgi:hypothetical protein
LAATVLHLFHGFHGEDHHRSKAMLFLAAYNPVGKIVRDTGDYGACGSTDIRTFRPHGAKQKSDAYCTYIPKPDARTG